LTLAVSSGLQASQVRKTIFAHPTLSEAIKEALSE
jgi:pyruvate/2-oxoglutarate dehydrogenase complex dihydrolipoamide dehydrogenase (E3) component